MSIHLIKLLISLFALLPWFVSAQLSKGFNLLEQSKYDKAVEAFESVVNDEKDGAGAKYGLASCYYRKPGSNGELAKGFGLLRSAKVQYRKLGQEDKNRLSKHQISAASYDKLMEDIQVLAIKQAEANSSLLQLDTVMDNMTPMSAPVQKRLEAARKQLVDYAVQNASDYQTLTSLVKKHAWLVNSKSFRDMGSVKKRLWNAFIDEYGYERLSKFVADHPKDGLSIDCWVHELCDALNPISVKKLVRFLIDHPNSTLDVFADSHIRVKTKYGTDTQYDALLNQEEKKQLELLKIGWEIRKIIRYDYRKFDDAAMKNLMTYMEQKRSTRIAFDLMQSSVEKCLKTRQWDMASRILEAAKPLFPDFQPQGCKTRFTDYHNKQNWFNTVMPIVDRPAEGIFRKYVAGINTKNGDEYAPVPTADGKSLYFVATGRPSNIGGEDIFVAHYDYSTKTWSEPELVPSLSSPQNESPVAITFDGNEMLLFREGKLYTSRLTNSGWSAAKPLPDAINGFPWIGDATFNSTGNVMIFTASETLPELDQDSNRDLFVSHKDEKGEWGAPLPLGYDVNTFEDERSPFLYPDDVTLYFSSGGHPGLGNLDIFYTKRLDDTWLNWSVPKNLGKEVNSLGDDWGYSISMNPVAWEVYTAKADFNSDQEDIYVSDLPSFARPRKVVPYSGKVVKRGTSIGVASKIVVSNPETGEPLDTIFTQPDGNFTVRLLEGMKEVSFHVEGERLYPQSKVVPLSRIVSDPGHSDLIEVSTLEEMIEKKIPATLNNINFDYDKSELRPESYPELTRLCNLFRSEKWRVEISGHTDNVGTPEYNLALSQRRAESVKAFLVSKGISAGRLGTRGYGAEKPVASNETEEGRAQNRRVEIVIQE